MLNIALMPNVAVSPVLFSQVFLNIINLGLKF